MKCRAAVSQNSHSPLSLQATSRRRAYTPLGTPISKPKMRSITTESLQTYDIDITQRPHLQSCKAEVKAVLQLQQRLRTRASQFIARLAKEKMHLKGRLMLRKQEEQERRQIKLEIDRYERTLREKKEMMQKREKYLKKAHFFDRKVQERQLNKINTRKHASLLRSEPSNKKMNIEKSRSQRRRFPEQQKSQQIKLKNSIYLDEQQTKVQQTRKRLIQLQSTIQNVERLRLEC